MLACMLGVRVFFAQHLQAQRTVGGEDETVRRRMPRRAEKDDQHQSPENCSVAHILL